MIFIPDYINFGYRWFATAGIPPKSLKAYQSSTRGCRVKFRTDVNNLEAYDDSDTSESTEAV